VFFDFLTKPQHCPAKVISDYHRKGLADGAKDDDQLLALQLFNMERDAGPDGADFNTFYLLPGQAGVPFGNLQQGNRWIRRSVWKGRSGLGARWPVQAAESGSD
jgi:hypothetical protein